MQLFDDLRCKIRPGGIAFPPAAKSNGAREPTWKFHVHEMDESASFRKLLRGTP
jgi:hypothetical protein